MRLVLTVPVFLVLCGVWRVQSRGGTRFSVRGSGSSTTAYCLNEKLVVPDWFDGFLHRQSELLCPTWANYWHVNSLTVEQKRYVQIYLGHFSILWLQIFRIIVVIYCKHDYHWRFSSWAHQKIWRKNLEILLTISGFSGQHIFENQISKFGQMAVRKIHLSCFTLKSWTINMEKCPK